LTNINTYLIIERLCIRSEYVWNKVYTSVF